MKDFIKNFKKFDKIHLSLIYLLQIYSIWNTVWSLLMNIYVYKYFGSLNGLFLYNTIIYIFLFLGFVLISFIISWFKLNIKLWYYIAYLMFIIWFTMLYFWWKNEIIVYLFTFFFGIWSGSFRASNHYYEMSDIDVQKRDFYSSSVTLIKNIVTILVPFLISLVFIISDKINFDGYKIMFLLMPLIYFTSIFYIKNLSTIFAKKIKFKDITKNFHIKELYVNLYYIFWVQTTFVPKLTLTILTIYILETEIKIWVYKGLLWLVSIFITAFLSTKRNESNRLKIMTIFAILIFINYIFLGFNMNFIWLLIYSIINYILSPGFDISRKVYYMKYMWTSKKTDWDYFPKIIFREFFLLIWRFLFLIPYLFFIKFSNFSLENLIKFWIFYCWIIYFFTVWIIYLQELKIKRQTY